MARPRHVEEPGATFHVTIHAVEGGTIVRDDADRFRLLDIVATVVGRQEWLCLAFCILDTHYHLLVTTPKPNLAGGMQLINGMHAQLFNRRHRRRGALFRERYRRKITGGDAHLLLTIRYIARNPVVAGIAAEASEARWSSYPGVVGVTPCWPFIARAELLEYFGGPVAGLALLRDFVEGPFEQDERAA
jgi:putative transposase